jgi:uncharacterized membrane protein YfcA
MLLAIGVPVAGFACLQLAGWQPHLTGQTRALDAGIGGFAGFIGGLSGVWGPPLVAYLVAINEEKREVIRIQGVVYGLGAVMLAAAHLHSGVLDADTLPLSAAAVVPVLAGLWLGTRLHDRMPQHTFRRAMLVVLVVAGLNLVRRALMV